MKCQILFSGKNKKNITNLSSAELAKREVKVSYTKSINIFHFCLSKCMLWNLLESLQKVIPVPWYVPTTYISVDKCEKYLPEFSFYADLQIGGWG